MPLTAGDTVGPYRIVDKLGEGGMGQVYRARDTRLERDVALKILPPAVAADPERVRRFEREAKTLAALNHPNIAALYGIEELPSSGRGQAGGLALVMELVPGRTLEEILRPKFEGGSSKFEISEAIVIARAIAEALEAAHDAGIIHRDLKPANIKVRDDGTVKLLDFGLAKALAADGAASDPAGAGANSPTMTSPAHAATEAGIVLGTAGYMSPEQARGRVADKRADIWAFGVVFYEMLTGKRLFGGEGVTEVIASVIKDAPALDALPPETPESVRDLLARCLDRDPKTRLRDVGEARILLTRASGPGHGPAAQPASGPARGSVAQTSATATPRTGRLAIAFGAAALALAGIAAAIAWNLRPAAPETPVRRFDLPALADAIDVAISPDGTRIAYLRSGHLYVRALSARDAVDLGPVPPTAGDVFWSPDSRRIAYGGESTLRIVPADGGATFIVCKVPAPSRILDGLWRSDGTILFAASRESIYRVAATGGTPEVHVALDPKLEVDFHSLTELADGRLVVTTHLRESDGVRMDLVAGGKRTPLADDLEIENARFLAPNHLLFVRLRTNPGTWVVPADGDRVDLARATLIEPGATRFDVSLEGTVISIIPATEKRELVWATFSKRVTGDLGSGAATTAQTRSVETIPGTPFEAVRPSLAIAPDGRRAVIAVRSPNGRQEFLVRDMATGVDTRIALPQTPTGMTIGSLVSWTPRGRLLYAAGGGESEQIYDAPSDGSGSGRPLVTGMFARMLHDGSEVLFNRDEQSIFRLYRAAIGPDGTVGEARPVFTRDNEPSVRSFDISPDGKLLAFTTVESPSGQLNIFVATYPDLSQRRQVTTNGGTHPRFSRTGRELFYLTGTRTVVGTQARGELRVVGITPAPLSIGVPQLLYTETEGPGALTLTSFDVGADGRLLMTRTIPPAPGDEGRIVLLQNWMAAIRK